ncbi:hypothetical protein LCGC14_2608320, partial [marine sediment metagenome]
DKVGEGAMGEVYKAHDPILNRYVAIKTIAESRDADPELRQRFLREAQSADTDSLIEAVQKALNLKRNGQAFVTRNLMTMTGG